MDQVAVGAVQFDAVEAGRQRAAGEKVSIPSLAGLPQRIDEILRLVPRAAGDEPHLAAADGVIGQRHPHRAHRRLDAVLPRRDAAQFGQRAHHADGAVPAHAQVADVVEEDDARRVFRLVGIEEESPDDDVRTSGLENDAASEVVVAFP